LYIPSSAWRSDPPPPFWDMASRERRRSSSRRLATDFSRPSRPLLLSIGEARVTMVANTTIAMKALSRFWGSVSISIMVASPRT
jgi:hypothetical protein